MLIVVVVVTSFNREREYLYAISPIVTYQPFPFTPAVPFRRSPRKLGNLSGKPAGIFPIVGETDETTVVAVVVGQLKARRPSAAAGVRPR